MMYLYTACQLPVWNNYRATHLTKMCDFQEPLLALACSAGSLDHISTKNIFKKAFGTDMQRCEHVDSVSGQMLHICPSWIWLSSDTTKSKSYVEE